MIRSGRITIADRRDRVIVVGCMSVPRKKFLGRLETVDRRLIAVGGAELIADGTGFFITEPGTDMAPILPGQEAIVSSNHGQVFASVSNLQSAPATSALPRRYTFTYFGTVPIGTALSRQAGAKPASKALRMGAGQQRNGSNASPSSAPGKDARRKARIPR